MCDLYTRDTTCPGSPRNRLKPLKLSKYELSPPNSKTYWDGVFAEIEENPKKVRKSNPYFPISKLPTSKLITQLSDDIKFKISPPTPMHKSRQSIIKSKDYDFDNQFLTVVSDEQLNNRLETIKLPTEISAKIDSKIRNRVPKEIKIYPKKSCPHHSKKALHSTTKLPSVPKENKIPCKHRLSIIKKKSNITSTSSPPSTEIIHKTITKAPKLGKASLLPSFAKPVSTDSSAGSPDSLESEEEKKKKKKENDFLKVESPENVKSKVLRRDFLRVPNLRFVSAHPSFRKLSFKDSCDEEESIDSQEDISFLPYEEPLLFKEDNLSCENKLIEESEKSVISEKNDVASFKEKIKYEKTFVDYERKYIRKALDLITKYKHLEFSKELDNFVEKELLSTKASVESDIKHKNKKIKYQDEDQPIPFQEMHEQLKNAALKYLNLNVKQPPKKLNKTDSIKISTSSRSTSGPSLDFQSNGISISSSNVLNNIPKARIYPRAYFDKCHTCLYKPYMSHTKIKRELPLTKLKSIVDEDPIFDISSSISSSTSDESIDHYYRGSKKTTFSYLPKIVRPMSGTNDRSNNQLTEDDSIAQTQTSLKSSLLSPSRTIQSSSKTPSPKQSPRSVKYHSLSLQSSDRSKTSSPSNQSSESEDQDLDDKAQNSKFKAPCHAPVVWRPSLEPWRAMKLKKFTSLKARAAVLVAKSGEDSDNSEDGTKSPDKIVPQEEEGTDKEDKKTEKKKKKSKKELIRVKTAEEISSTPLKISDDDSQIKDVKAGRILKRAKTTFDLMKMSDESSEESEEDEEIAAENKKEAEMKEQIPCFDVVVVHQADSNLPKNVTEKDIAIIVKECLGNELFRKMNDKLMGILAIAFKQKENLKEN